MLRVLLQDRQIPLLALLLLVSLLGLYATRPRLPLRPPVPRPDLKVQRVGERLWRWAPPRGARHYRIEVFSAGLDRLGCWTLVRPEWQPPTSLPEAAVLVWVEALDAGGRTLAWSGPLLWREPR